MTSQNIDIPNTITTIEVPDTTTHITMKMATGQSDRDILEMKMLQKADIDTDITAGAEERRIETRKRKTLRRGLTGVK